MIFRNSEAFASEFPENIEEMSLWYYAFIEISVAGLNIVYYSMSSVDEWLKWPYVLCRTTVERE